MMNSKHKYIKPWLIDIFSVLAGGVLPFAFAPFYLFWLAPIALVVLLLIWLHSTSMRAAFRGFLFGLGFFGVGVSWVFVSIHVFGSAPIPLAALLTALFIIALAFFPAVQGYLFSKFYPSNRLTTLLVAFPASWVVFDFLRSWMFTGFPWLFIGYSQTNSPLSGYAPLFSVYGVTFMVAITAGLIVGIFIQKKKARGCCLFLLVAVWLVGGMLVTINWTKLSGKPIKVSIVQGNIPQQIKWTSGQVIPTMRLYQKLTLEHLNSDIILWPEAAIPVTLQNAAYYLTKLAITAKRHHASVMLGIPVQGANDKFYNAAIMIGNGHGSYYKQHLVPFGEYVPLEHWLRGLIKFFDLPMSDFSSGIAGQPLLTAGKIKVAAYICYEMAYANLVRSDLPKAQLLITISNDAWFGKSWASAQHLQIGQMRAIETGRYMLFGTNNGITAIINPHGKIIKSLPRFKRDVLSGKVYAMNGSTLWVMIGSWPIIIGCFVLLLISIRKKK